MKGKELWDYLEQEAIVKHGKDNTWFASNINIQNSVAIVKIDHRHSKSSIRTFVNMPRRSNA